MGEVKRSGSLETEEDLAFQAWQWRAAQALWVILLAVMVATVLGVFGSGPLSRARAGPVDSPLWVEYDRLARFGAAVRLVVHARPQADGEVRFTIGRSLVDAFRVQQVTPSPSSTIVLDDGVEYRFRTGGTETATVMFELQSATRWAVEGRIASPDASVTLNHFIFP